MTLSTPASGAGKNNYRAERFAGDAGDVAIGGEIPAIRKVMENIADLSTLSKPISKSELEKWHANTLSDISKNQAFLSGWKLATDVVDSRVKEKKLKVEEGQKVLNIAAGAYATDGFHTIFEQFRKSLEPVGLETFIYKNYYSCLLLSMMHLKGAKLPGSNTQIFRVCNATLAELQPSLGQRYLFKSFVSTTLDSKKAMLSLERNGVLFEIHGAFTTTSGLFVLDCRQHSQFAEDEFLLWSLKEFEVKKIEQRTTTREIKIGGKTSKVDLMFYNIQLHLVK